MYLIFLPTVIILIFLLLVSAIKIIPEYERAVVFTLGKYWKTKGPGLIIIIPLAQQMIRVSLRTVVMDVPSQDVITRDNVTIKVDAVVFLKAISPKDAILNVENYLVATGQLAQTTLRSVIGNNTLDVILQERDNINARIQKVLDEATDPWGVQVSAVEVKKVELAPQLISALSKQAEAERLKRAKIINSEGELQAAEKLFEAAQILAKAPGAMQLRQLETLGNIAGDKTNTIVFPLDSMITSLMGKRG